MRAEQRQSEPSLEELRIRLEGAYEIVETAAARYAALDKLLSSGKWRKALRLEPDLMEGLLRLEGSVRQARENCERFAASNAELSGPVPTALAKLSEARAGLHQTTLRRLRAKTALPLEDALSQLNARVLAEIPGNLRPGEKRLMEGSSGKSYWIASLTVLYGLALAASPLIDFIEREGPEFFKAFAKLGVLGGIALLFWVPFLISWLTSGTYTLTNQRLIWTPKKGEQVQVELSQLKPGAFVISPILKQITVEALEPFTIRGVENAPQLAAYAEMTRWLSTKSAGAESLTDVAIFPAYDGESALWQSDGIHDTGIPGARGVAVMRPDYAAFFKVADAGVALQAITGNSPGKSVDLEAALGLLRQLGAAQFDEVVRAAAKTHGVLFERTTSSIASVGPVWEHLIVRAPHRSFAAKVTWRHLEQVEAMVAKWRAATAS